MQFLEYNENKQRGTYDFPFEYYYVDETHPQYEMSYHWHVEYEIIRIIDGSFEISLDEKKLLAKKGDIIFIHSGVLHFGTPKNCIYECLVFDLNAFLKHNPSCKASINKIKDQDVLIYHQFHEQHVEISQVISNVFEAMKLKYEGYPLITFGELYHFFGLVFKNHYYLEDAPKTRKDYKRIQQLRHVLDLIESSYAQPLTLEQLSEAANMSPKYFCRFFYEMTHKTPIDYLNYQRIEHACYQLATSNDSVTEIALNCGFNELSYFIRTFKKYKGTTPGKYKR